MLKPLCRMFILSVAVSGSNFAFSQNSYADLPDSPSYISQPATHGGRLRSGRDVSWKSPPRDFLQDQKNIRLFPTELAKGHQWLPTLAVVGGTAGLIYADPHVMPYFREHANGWDDFNDVFDPMITTAEVMTVPVSLLTAGYIRHDSYQVGTAILCAEAYGDSASR